jgi:MFS family permease
MPAKGTSGLYFSALGLGFMMLEVSLIQKLTLLLGYPTYSLTVTIASILVAAGFGALLSDRLAKPGPKVMWLVVACLAGLVTLYQFGLGPITVALLPASLGIRVAVTVLMLIPLGLCLGMFMPLGLGQVARLGGENHQDYVAWSWAINGFFSVIGSVATTILSMIFGFRTVMFLALGIYGVAALAFQFLARHKPIELTDSDQESIDLVGDHEISVAINA